jgi:hypothetical protein
VQGLRSLAVADFAFAQLHNYMFKHVAACEIYYCERSIGRDLLHSGGNLHLVDDTGLHCPLAANVFAICMDAQ